MAFETSTGSNTSSKKPEMRLTLQDGDKNRTYINLFRRATKDGKGHFFVGNPSERDENGAYINSPESFFVMPRKEGGAVLKYREGQGADLQVLGELKDSESFPGTMYGKTSTGLSIYVDKWLSKAEREAKAAKTE